MPYNLEAGKGFDPHAGPTNVHVPVDIAIDTVYNLFRTLVNTPLGIVATFLGSGSAVIKDISGYVSDEIPTFLDVVGNGFGDGVVS